MRLIRFSLRRLLIITALAAVLLYVLYLRPVAIAKQFIHEFETSTDLDSVSRQYFRGMNYDKATLESELQKRTWSDVFRCRQNFTITMKRMSLNIPTSKHFVFRSRDYYATPIGIQERGTLNIGIREEQQLDSQ